MSDNNTEPRLASPGQVADELQKLKKVDKNKMLDNAFQMPEHILLGIEAARGFDEGDPPLDRSKIHMVGLGGSAIAGELLNDMLAPQQLISLYGGTNPPRDKRGVIVSSYSGNTREVLELAHRVTGGLRTVVFLTSNGELARLGEEWAVPVWRIPTGYQPRATVGWSLSLSLSLMERWRVISGALKKLNRAAGRLKVSLESTDLNEHILAQAALPIAEAVKDKHTVIFHSLRCTGAARRLAAQLNENAKQPACIQQVPEAMHNAVQGIAGASPDAWALIFMSDSNNDTPTLRTSMLRTQQFFTDLGFSCLPYPAAGDDEFEVTLSRLFLADLTSLLLAGLKGIDPTPIDVITDLKEVEEEGVKQGSKPE